MTLKVFIASDHAGLNLKNFVKDYIQAKQYDVVDLGTDVLDSVDYPDFGYMLAEQMKQNSDALGILVCGTGIGIAIAANRYAHIRAAACRSSTDARLTRAHNNANVVCLGERTTGTEVAKDIIDTFFATKFEEGRHVQRVEKLSNPV